MTKFTAKICDDKDKRRLNELYERSPRFLTQHPALPRVLTETGFHLGIFRHEEPICAIGFVPRKSTLETEWISPWFVPFSGPMADEYFYQPVQAADKFWRDVWKAVIEFDGEFPDFVSFVAPPGVIDCRELAWNGWEASPHYNYISKWDVDGEWLDKFDNNARRQINKARDSGTLRDAIYSAQDTEQLQKLWETNAEYQGLDPELSETIGSLGNWLDQLGCGFIVSIEDKGGGAHAVGLFGYDNHRVYYLAGASDPGEKGTGAPSWLHARAMEEIDQRGLPKVYDWVGANTPNIVSFKQNFAPTLEMNLVVRRQGRKSKLLRGIRDLRKS